MMFKTEDNGQQGPWPINVYNILDPSTKYQTSAN